MNPGLPHRGHGALAASAAVRRRQARQSVAARARTGPSHRMQRREHSTHRPVAVSTRLLHIPDTSQSTGDTLHDFTQNQIWLAVVALALDLTAWMQLLGFQDAPARRWEPKRLRLRIFSTAGRLARHARQIRLHLPRHAPWRQLVMTALSRLHAPPAAVA